MSEEKAFIMVHSIDGKHDVTDLKDKLTHMHGIESVRVDSTSDCIAVYYNSAGTSYDKIENCLNKLGCEIAADASDIHTI